MTIQLYSEIDPTKVAAAPEKTSSAPDAPTSEPEQKRDAESDPAQTEDPKEDAKGEPEADATESQDDADEAKDEPEAQEKPKKKGGFQRRIDKLNAQKSAAQQEAEYWREQALKAQGAKPAAEPEAKPEANGKPRAEEYESHEAYLDARDAWNRSQWQAEQQREKLESEHKSRLSAHQARMDEYAKEHADFADAIEDLRDAGIRLSPAVDDRLITRKAGPALLHALAKDPDELKRINALSPLDAVTELALLEAKILSASSEPKPQETKKPKPAPTPISPVGSKGGTVERSLADIAKNGTLKDWEAARAKAR